jgi:hypothetical protein
MEKPGMIWCRRPKPMNDCRVRRGKSVTRIIRPLFFSGTITSYRYIG